MIRYKGYTIEPRVVCFDIRYLVFGEGFYFEHFKTIPDAKRAIDKHIVKRMVDSMIDSLAAAADVNRSLVHEVIQEIFMEGLQ